MVDHIEGNGQHYKRAMQEHRLRPGFKAIRLLDAADQAKMLEDLARYPDFDARSFLILGALTGNREPKNVLVVPADCPRLTGTAPEVTPGLNEGETFVVEAWDRLHPKRIRTCFCIAESEEQAERLAKADVGRTFGVFGHNIKVNQPTLVTPDEFRVLIRKAVRRQQHVPRFILEKAGLWEYSQEIRSNGRS